MKTVDIDNALHRIMAAFAVSNMDVSQFLTEGDGKLPEYDIESEFKKLAKRSGKTVSWLKTRASKLITVMEKESEVYRILRIARVF